MSADSLNGTTYNNVAANTADQTVLDADMILAWRLNVKTTVDQHATEINAIEAASGAMRQAAINGNFSVNQLVVSGTVTLVAGAYGHDMWKAGASGCTYTFSTSNNVTTITITAGSLIQVIEGVNLYSGTYTLSWTGTAQGKIGAGSYGASGITGTVVGGTNTNIEFNTGTLSKVQFNAGSIALPFQPRSFGEERALCQRFFRRLGFGAVGRWTGANAAEIGAALGTPMRIAPNISLNKTNPIMSEVGIASRAGSGSVLSFSSKSPNGYHITITGFSGATSGSTAILEDDALDFDARL